MYNAGSTEKQPSVAMQHETVNLMHMHQGLIIGNVYMIKFKKSESKKKFKAMQISQIFFQKNSQCASDDLQ